MDMHFRQFEKTEDDYTAGVAAWQAVYPDIPMTVDEWQQNDANRDPDYFFRREMVEVKGQVVGVGAAYQSPYSLDRGKLWIVLWLHPEFQGRGIGTAWFAHMMDIIKEYQPHTLISSTREDQPGGIRFLEKMGFRLKQRDARSLLNVQAFEPAPFESVLSHVEEQGFRIYTIRQLMHLDPDWLVKARDLDHEVLLAVPGIENLKKRSLEQFQKDVLDSIGAQWDGYFIAVAQAGDGVIGEYAGLCRLWGMATHPEVLHNTLTGVLARYRRRGIATALKLHSICFARDYGAQTIETDNEENNPMYRINLNLGFKPAPAWLEYEKTLSDND